MTLVLAVPTYRRFDLLADCVWSARAGTVKPDFTIVIDNSGGACPAIPGAEVIPGRQPQSVARAWNDAVTLAGGADLLLCNDDIVFAPDTIERLLAARTPQAGIVSAIEGERFSLFWLNLEAYRNVGPFDEQFAPAYFEDNDYARRLTVAGWELAVAPSAVRHGGSQTLASYTPAERRAHDAQFEANRARYVKKHGGLPGQEVR